MFDIIIKKANKYLAIFINGGYDYVTFSKGCI